MEFAEFYFLLMDEYRVKDGWWKDSDSVPCFSECNKEISGPKELRRYYGISLHDNCFKQVYLSDNVSNPVDKIYFDRVANITGF